MESNFYFNRADDFLDLPKNMRGELSEFPNYGPCQAIQEDFQWRVNAILGKKLIIKYFIKITL